MKKLQAILLAIMTVLSLSVVAVGPSVSALDPGGEIQKGIDGAGGAGQKPLNVRIKEIVNVLLFILGIISVIVIVIGGIRYTTSGGDSSQVTGAKNTVLYAVVGLIVAILAYAIVNFVVGAFR